MTLAESFGSLKVGTAMRQLYTVTFYLLLPLVFLRLALRGLRARAYWRRWPERLGYGRGSSTQRPLWVHAVSVGEVHAALPLVSALGRCFPELPILITTTTPTGSAAVKAAFGERVDHVYLPLDLPGAVRRFYRRLRPRLGVIMETELWPNLMAAAHEKGIPLMLVNARLSERSAARYRRAGPLLRETLGYLNLIAAQSGADADRFLQLGAHPEQVRVIGNLKFDLELAEGLEADGRELRLEIAGERPVWIAASTHEGEESVVLAAFDRIREHMPESLLILVPRRPERFGKVELLCRQAGYRVLLRTTMKAGEVSQADVFLGDTMGELRLFYAAADVAFVGGSLVPVGGHNLVEPAALGLPVITGPHVQNCRSVCRMFQRAGVCQEVNDAEAMADAILTHLNVPQDRRILGTRARLLVEENRGTLARLLRLINAQLQYAPGRAPEALTINGPTSVEGSLPKGHDPYRLRTH